MNRVRQCQVEVAEVVCHPQPIPSTGAAAQSTFKVRREVTLIIVHISAGDPRSDIRGNVVEDAPAPHISQQESAKAMPSLVLPPLRGSGEVPLLVLSR